AVIVRDGASTGVQSFNPSFGSGWALAGVPELYVDPQFGEGLINQTANRDDRIILAFPGEEPRLFRATSASFAFDYSGDFTPVTVGSNYAAPEEFGTLTASNDGAEITYTAADGTKYVFTKYVVAEDPVWL